jgi:catechol 2,3-dioxygenase-like lactoylglutathione lyase family enzyme/uncharacterized protein YciI
MERAAHGYPWGSHCPAMAVKRPGPKPRRLYLRWVELAPGTTPERPPLRETHRHWRELERVGRLVAAGRTTAPTGDLLVLRATDPTEAERALRSDPWRRVEGVRIHLIEWDPQGTGSGVNLEPAPARGSGRITALDRVAVVVRRQDEARRWYEEILGLRVRREDPETAYVELAFGRGSVGISLVTPRAEWGEPYYSETVTRIGTATGLVFETDSVEALGLRLRHAGARITEAARAQPWGGATIRFADPDGNEFLAFQREPLRERATPPGPAARSRPPGRSPAAPRRARAPREPT